MGTSLNRRKKMEGPGTRFLKQLDAKLERVIFVSVKWSHVFIEQCSALNRRSIASGVHVCNLVSLSF